MKGNRLTSSQIERSKDSMISVIYVNGLDDSIKRKDLKWSLIYPVTF